MYGLSDDYAEQSEELSAAKKEIKELKKERDALYTLNQFLQKENRELREQVNILSV